VRERLYALSEVDGLLSGQVRKGPKGRKEYSPSVLEMLKEMEQLHGNLGKSLREAAEEIAGKIEHNGNEELPEPSGKDVNLTVKVAELEAKVEGLERLLRAREDELAYLRDRVAFLEGQLALPKPEPAARGGAGLSLSGSRPHNGAGRAIPADQRPGSPPAARPLFSNAFSKSASRRWEVSLSAGERLPIMNWRW